MHNHNNSKWRVLLLVIAFLSCLKTVLAKQQDGNAPEISIVVFFERTTIREDDPVTAVIHIANNSDYDLMKLELAINSPEFLEWHYPDCESKTLQQSLPIKEIRAHTTLPPQQFCVRVKPSKGRVGDFNILVTLKYQWKADSVVKESQTTVEKSLNVNLFGTDKIIGIPLAFAGFIVPGLFFLLALRIRKVPISLNLQTDEKLIVSVLISVFCMGLVYVFRYLFDWSWTQYFDISNNVSIAKLFALTLAGLLLGGIVVLGYSIYTTRQKKKEREFLIYPNDDKVTLLTKILHLNAQYKGIAVVIRHKDNIEYIGSHWAETTDAIYLVGSFQVNIQELNDNTAKEIQKYTDEDGRLNQETDVLLKVLQLASANNRDSIKLRSPVQQIKNNETSFSRDYHKFNKEEVKSITPEWYKDVSLLELA